VTDQRGASVGITVRSPAVASRTRGWEGSISPGAESCNQLGLYSRKTGHAKLGMQNRPGERARRRKVRAGLDEFRYVAIFEKESTRYSTTGSSTQLQSTGTSLARVRTCTCAHVLVLRL
jgi:hypothetical protein